MSLSTEKIEKVFNLSIYLLIFIFIATIVLNIITIMNLSNSSPSNFIGIRVGNDPKVVKVIVQNKPVLSQESIKSWVKKSTNHFFNYNINNFKDVIKNGRPLMTAKFYNAFEIPRALKIIEIFASGYNISSSVVMEDPLLISKASINGIEYYKYFVKTSTVYKGDFKNVVSNHEIIMTVKIENPEDNPNGIAIDEMIIK